MTESPNPISPGHAQKFVALYGFLLGSYTVQPGQRPRALERTEIAVAARWLYAPKKTAAAADPRIL